MYEVIMAIYNGSAFIKKQVLSICSQSLPPCRIIFVDDFSSDDSIEIIKELMKSFPSIDYVVHRNQVNVGPSLSFKEGINLIQKPYFFFSDQDDFWDVEKASSMIKLMKEKGHLLLYSDGRLVNEMDEFLPHTIFSTRNRAKLNLGQSRNELEFVSNPDIKGCTMCLNTDFAKYFVNKTTNELWSLWGFDHLLALFAYGSKGLGVSNREFIFHRVHLNNTSGNFFYSGPLRFINKIKFLRKTTLRQKYPSSHFDKFILLCEWCNSQKLFDEMFSGAIHFHAHIARKRKGLLTTSFFNRILGALNILKSGYYHRFGNGLLSFLRDCITIK